VYGEELPGVGVYRAQTNTCLPLTSSLTSSIATTLLSFLGTRGTTPFKACTHRWTKTWLAPIILVWHVIAR